MATEDAPNKVDYMSSTLKSNVSTSSSSTGSTIKSPPPTYGLPKLSPPPSSSSATFTRPHPLSTTTTTTAPTPGYYNELDELGPLRTPSSTKSASSTGCVFFGPGHERLVASQQHQRYPSTASSSCTDDNLIAKTNTTNNNNNNNMLLLLNGATSSASVQRRASNESGHNSLANNNRHHWNANNTEGSGRSHEEDVYQDIVCITLRTERELGTLHLEPVEKRDYCIKELVETERNYCEALRMIITQFRKPLSTVLHHDDRRLIFNNLKSLTDLHSKFYQALYRACSQQQQQQPAATSAASSPATTASPNQSTTLFAFPATGSYLNTSTTSDGSLLLNNSSACNTPTSNGSLPNKAQSNWVVASSQGYVNESFTLCGNSPPAQQPSVLLNAAQPVPTSPFFPNRLSQCFLAFKDKFLIYGDYCANLPKAQALLDRLCAHDPVVAQAVDECQRQANGGRFKLRDLISLPMQRILKYHLLLGELIKSTGEAHEDFEGLRQAHEVMLDIGGYINEVKRDTETLEIVANIQKSILDLSMPDNYELKDYGRLVKDGELRVRSHDDPRLVMRTRYIFIFDKLLLMCKANKTHTKTYSCKEVILLETYKVEEVSNLSPISKLTTKSSHGFSLVSNQKAYTFYVKSEEIKRKWIEAFERAQDNFKPKVLRNSEHKFAMSSLPIATYCAVCTKLLQGIWYQGYKCDECALPVHKACLTGVIKSCGAVNSNNNTAASTVANNKVGQSTESTALPTPSRSKRTIVKAIVANSAVAGDTGRLTFELDDIIIVYNKPTACTWYGKNVRTEQEGRFEASLVTEVIADSPADTSSVDSPTVAPSAATMFSFEDPLGANLSAAASNFDNFRLMSTTLPKKFGSSKAASTTSMIPTAVSTMNLPTSPQFAFFAPNITPPAATSTPNAYSVGGNFFFGNNESNVAMMSAQQQQHQHEMEANQCLTYGNGYNLEEYTWFAGSMTREQAQQTLQALPNGAFLVRISPKQRNNYAISLKYSGQVKHMRVCLTEQPVGAVTTVQPAFRQAQQPQTPWPYRSYFYLSETRFFRTIVDLVRWYERYNLSEAFNMVDTKLVRPYKKYLWPGELGYARALFAFTGTSSANASFLSLRRGDHVTIISRSAEDKGWWKGQVEDRIGYFPLRYVEPEPTSHDLKMVMMAGYEFQNFKQQQQSASVLNISGESLGIRQDKPQQQQQPAQQPKSEVLKLSPSVSPFSVSSSASSNDSSSPTTLSSPVNSDTSSMHSRQASSDAGIDMLTTGVANTTTLIDNERRDRRPVDLESCFNQMALIQ